MDITWLVQEMLFTLVSYSEALIVIQDSTNQIHKELRPRFPWLLELCRLKGQGRALRKAFNAKPPADAISTPILLQ